MCKECGCGLDTALVCPECGGRMVLVNGQATCLACGATPAPGADPPEHEDHHHHHAGHTHEETKAEPDDLVKLRILLPHWIEHNEDHAVGFERWVAKARELGQEETAQWIEEAVGRMAACNQALNAALEALEG
ncbi:MAG: hypothetical protein SWK90_19985 [Chloroflexota bacterium]|nr:hypothetical protein [Chloroflexota bacterium]